MIQLRDVRNEVDFRFIIQRCVEEAKNGHFNESYATPMYQKGLEHQILCAVSDMPFPFEKANPRNGAGAKVFIIDRDGARVGFVLLVEDMPGSWNENVELQLVSVDPQFRGLGIGDWLIKALFNHPAREFYARCYSTSKTMSYLLKKNGFKLIAISNQGTETLVYRK